MHSNVWIFSLLLRLFIWNSLPEKSSGNELHPLNQLDAMNRIATSADMRQYLIERLSKLNQIYNLNWYQEEIIMSANMGNQSDRSCFRDYALIVRALARGQTWPFQFVDASGKMPPGMSGGSLTWMGSYEMCNLINADVNGDQIRGRYCNVRIPIVMDDPEIAVPIGLTMALCVPDSCTTEDAIKLAERSNQNICFYFQCFISPDSRLTTTIPIATKDTEVWKRIRGLSAPCMTVGAFVGTLLLLGSLVDFFLYQRWQRVYAYNHVDDLQQFIRANMLASNTEEIQNVHTGLSSSSSSGIGHSDMTMEHLRSQCLSEQSIIPDYKTYRAEFFRKYCLCGGFLLAFSLPYNIYNLWNTQPAQIRDEHGILRSHPLLHVDGIRVITMVWIMFVHVLTYQTYFSAQVR
ncbi:unnamed protein product [Echinostoma caproni]|uniref:NRF domain-containing protein n=1 Tax=Echinostoma caproni TaxID=27848 RepID=A0A183AZ92_9TREM|nr:unnamed protein product [Echinostoma caproni]